MNRLGTFISNNQRFIPLSATIILFLIVYAGGAIFYEGMRDPQVFLNLFRTTPFLLVSAIGMTFVILSGGIDLSVGGVIALTTVASAALIRAGWNPWLVMLLMLVMGMIMGATMGGFITYLKVQPFIATLAGMWVARGLCFFISDDAIAIDNRLYRILGQTKILIPGLSDVVTKQGDYISILVVLEVLVLAIAIYVAQYTRFGRTVYAIGGNEQSARLMGLPVNRTKVLVYTLSGFSSALAGITYSIYVLSGHGLYVTGFEMDVIASVVMGGTMLSGGQGYVFGTLFGVLINGLIQTLIQFNGQLSSWWTRIAVGLLTLIFIGVQSLLAARKSRMLGLGATDTAASSPLMTRRTLMMTGGGVIVLIVVAFGAILGAQNLAPGSAEGPAAASGCQLQPFRQDRAAALIREGAVIAYERNGGATCLDELYAIYPDGRIVGDNGAGTIEKQMTPEDIEILLKGISDKGWFTDAMYSTSHTPCGQCYTYYLTVVYHDQEKTVQAVDGGTDAPSIYWDIISLMNGTIPHFPTTP
jgi:simple sugar transport system permease protein